MKKEPNKNSGERKRRGERSWLEEKRRPERTAKDTPEERTRRGRGRREVPTEGRESVGDREEETHPEKDSREGQGEGEDDGDGVREGIVVGLGSGERNGSGADGNGGRGRASTTETAGEEEREEEEDGEPRRQERGAASEEIKILYLNAQSIVKKVDELECTASLTKPDLILVTESWCNNSISNKFYL